MKNMTLFIPQIHCSSCEALIKLSLKEFPGIKQSSVNSQTKTVDIEYDDGIISRDKIANHIQKETGYKVI